MYGVGEKRAEVVAKGVDRVWAWSTRIRAEGKIGSGNHGGKCQDRSSRARSDVRLHWSCLEIYTVRVASDQNRPRVKSQMVAHQQWIPSNDINSWSYDLSRWLTCRRCARVRRHEDSYWCSTRANCRVCAIVLGIQYWGLGKGRIMEAIIDDMLWSR